MINAQRTPMDLMDDIYTLAYWMTGSETAANELVNRTYLHVESHTPEREVFKTFRECYFDSFAGDTADCISQSAHKPKERLVLITPAGCRYKTFSTPFRNSRTQTPDDIENNRQTT